MYYSSLSTGLLKILLNNGATDRCTVSVHLLVWPQCVVSENINTPSPNKLKLFRFKSPPLLLKLYFPLQ